MWQKPLFRIKKLKKEDFLNGFTFKWRSYTPNEYSIWNTQIRLYIRPANARAIVAQLLKSSQIALEWGFWMVNNGDKSLLGCDMSPWFFMVPTNHLHQSLKYNKISLFHWKHMRITGSFQRFITLALSFDCSCSRKHFKKLFTLFGGIHELWTSYDFSVTMNLYLKCFWIF